MRTRTDSIDFSRESSFPCNFSSCSYIVRRCSFERATERWLFTVEQRPETGRIAVFPRSISSSNDARLKNAFFRTLFPSLCKHPRKKFFLILFFYAFFFFILLIFFRTIHSRRLYFLFFSFDRLFATIFQVVVKTADRLVKKEIEGKSGITEDSAKE